MTDLDGLAVQATALKVLGEKVSERAAEVKAQLAEAMTPGDRKTAALDDGTTVGSVTYAKASWSASVTDPRELAKWVLDHYPDEIEPMVRPAFVTAILTASKAACVPMAPDGTLDVPGVRVSKGDPYISVRPDKTQTAALIEAVRANQVLAIEDQV